MKKIIILILIFSLISCKHKNPSPAIKTDINFKKLDSLVNVYSKKNLKERIKFFDTFQNKNIEKAPPKFQWKIFHQKGKAELQSKKYKEAKNNFKNAIIIAKHLKDHHALIQSKINLGIVYTLQKKTNDALKVLYESLKLTKQYNYTDLENYIKVALSHIYFLSKDYEKGLKLLKQIEKEQIKNNDSISLAATYQNIANHYKRLNNLQKAYEYYLKGLHLKLKTGDDAYLSKFYSNLGILNFSMGKPLDSSLYYFLKAKEKAIPAPSADLYKLIGVIYMEKKQFDSAKYYYQKSLSISKTKEDSIKAYDAFLNLSARNHDNKEIVWLSKKDSLQLQLEKEKNIQKIKLLEKNHKLNMEKIELELKNQKLKKNLRLYWLIGITVFLFLISIFLIYRNKNLKTQKEKIKLEKKLLRQQLKPHFIFNSLAALQKTLIYDSPVKAISYLSNFGNLMRKNFEFVNREEIPLKQEIELLENYIELQNIKLEKAIDFRINISSKINPKKVLVPPLLLQPIIENSIEHGFRDIDYQGKIFINIFKKNDLLCFEIVDNGRGLSKIKDSEEEHALDIIKKRIKIFNNNKKYIFRIANVSEGVKVYFCLHFKK